MRLFGVMIFCFVDFLRVVFVCDRVVWCNCVSATDGWPDTDRTQDQVIIKNI